MKLHLNPPPPIVNLLCGVKLSKGTAFPCLYLYHTKNAINYSEATLVFTCLRCSIFLTRNISWIECKNGFLAVYVHVYCTAVIFAVENSKN